MKNSLLFITTVTLFALLLVGKSSFAQNELLYSQTIVDKEFINPAYNAIKGFASVNILKSEQWKNKIEGAPKSMALNGYMPIKKSGLGIGLNIIGEEIGLRENILINVNLSQKIRLSRNSFVAMGLGIGVQKSNYAIKDIISLAEQGEYSGLDYDETNPQLIMGLFYGTPTYYAGISTNIMIAGLSDGNHMLPGFDLSAGYKIRTNALKIIPDIGYTYYKVRESLKLGEKDKYVSNSVSILTASCSVIIADKIQLATGHRFNFSQSFSFDIIIQKKLKVGYVYEIGVGDRVNIFDSQGIRLSVDLSGKRKKGRSTLKNLGFIYF